MRRAAVLVGLMAVGGLVAVLAQPADGPKVVDVEKVKDNLFVLRGGGGNTAVFVMANGVAVVDAKNPGWGRPILDKIKELTPKPVTLLINTHTHGDHVSGNVEFPASVDVVIMCNVLHEIPPASWRRLFTEQILTHALKDDGYLLILEDMGIPYGEKAHQHGFILLDTEQLQTLFAVDREDPREFFSDSESGEGRLKAHLIRAEALRKVTAATVKVNGIIPSRLANRMNMKRLKTKGKYCRPSLPTFSFSMFAMNS